MTATRYLSEVQAILIRAVTLPLILALDVAIVAYVMERVL